MKVAAETLKNNIRTASETSGERFRTDPDILFIGFAIGFDSQNISIANPIPIAMVKIHAFALGNLYVIIDIITSLCYLFLNS